MGSVEFGIFAHYKQMRQALAKIRKQAVASVKHNESRDGPIMKRTPYVEISMSS